MTTTDINDIKKVELFPDGIIKMPPSKSVAHRAVICAGLSGGGTVLNLTRSEDITATLRCMELLQHGGSEHVLDCGESGSTLRFLIPVAAALRDNSIFKGRGRLMERPLGPYFSELARHGTKLELVNGLLSCNGRLKSGEYSIPGDISSQFVSGLLLALPLTGKPSAVNVTTPLQSKSYAELTVSVMAEYGVKVIYDGERRFEIDGGQRYSVRDHEVEGDYSQAAFFLVAGALGCDCGCSGLSAESKQGDRKILDILKECGAELEIHDGTVYAKPGKLRALTVDVTDIPDLVPPLAVLLTFAEGRSVITGAGRLRLKESDRLESVSGELNALGARIEIDGDTLVIDGVTELSGGQVDSRNDHRIAMMGAVAAIKCRGSVEVHGASCVKKSYPDFWEDFGCATL